MIVKANESNVLVLGRPGENETTTIVFDITPYREEFGIGDAQVMVTRPGESEPYPVALTKTTDTVEWTTQLADVFKPGKGRAQLTYYVGGKAVKSTIYTTMVLDSLQSVPEPPEPMQGWVEQITQIGAQATVDANKAKSYAVGGTGTREGEDTDNAKYYSEQAKASETAVTKSVEEVEKARAEVQRNKESVDKTKGEVDTNAKQVEQDRVQTGKDVESAKASEENSRKYSNNAKQSEDNAKASELAVNEKVDGFTDAVVKATETAVKSVTAEGEKQREILTDITKPLASNEDLMKLAIKPEVSENPIVLNDSADFPVVSLELSGSTEQVVTSGKNLFNGWEKGALNDKGDLLPTGTMYWRSKDFIPVKEGTYVISDELNGTTPSIYICHYDSNKMYLETTKSYSKLTNMNPITVKSTTAFIKIMIEFQKDTELSTVLKNTQLEKGSVATEYEPYTGGEPSPSPNYPQEIVMGEWNEISDTGKNIVDSSKAQIGYYTDGDGSVNRSPNYRFLPKIKVIGGESISITSDGGVYSLWQFGKNEEPIKVLYGLKKTKLVENCYFIGISFYPNTENLQIEYGTTPTTYEPYKGFTKTLPQKITLSKWDKIKMIDGMWQKEKWTQTVLFDGSEDERWSVQGTFAFISIWHDYKKPAYCDKYIQNKAVGIVPNKEGYFSSTVNKYAFHFYTTLSADEWKKQLSQNPVTVVYKKEEMESPTYEVLPPEAQDLLNKIVTFYPNTVLSTNEGITLNLKYVADTKNYIDNKHNKDIAELQAMLLER